MSWKINGTVIPSPTSKSVIYNTQKVTNRVISGAVNRDYIGTERVDYQCEWQHILAADLATLKAFYDSQRLSNTTMLLTIDELAVTNLQVIIDLEDIAYEIPNNYEWAHLKISFLQM